MIRTRMFLGLLHHFFYRRAPRYEIAIHTHVSASQNLGHLSPLLRLHSVPARRDTTARLRPGQLFAHPYRPFGSKQPPTLSIASLLVREEWEKLDTSLFIRLYSSMVEETGRTGGLDPIAIQAQRIFATRSYFQRPMLLGIALPM